MLLSKMVGCFAASYGGAPVTGLTNLLVEVSSLTKRMQPVTCLPHQLLADRVSPPKKLIHTISLLAADIVNPQIQKIHQIQDDQGVLREGVLHPLETGADFLADQGDGLIG
jgi:hypothetical protein